MSAGTMTVHPLNEKIGGEVRRIRREVLGLTQAEFAERLGRPELQGQISRWESGQVRPNLETLHRIAEIGDVSMAVFGLEEREGPSEADVAEAKMLLRRALELLGGME